MRIHEIYICAVWLVKARRTDPDTIKVWSQFLDCSMGILNNAVIQAQRCDKNLAGNPCTNRAVSQTWETLKSFTVNETKLLLKRARSEKDEEK